MPLSSSNHKLRSNAVKSGFSLLDMSTSFARLPLTDALLDWGFCHQTFLWLLSAVFLKKIDLFILSKITLLAHQVVTGQSKPTALRNQRELVDSLTGQLGGLKAAWACLSALLRCVIRTLLPWDTPAQGGRKRACESALTYQSVEGGRPSVACATTIKITKLYPKTIRHFSLPIQQIR